MHCGAKSQPSTKKAIPKTKKKVEYKKFKKFFEKIFCKFFLLLLKSAHVVICFGKVNKKIGQLLQFWQWSIMMPQGIRRLFLRHPLFWGVFLAVVVALASCEEEETFEEEILPSVSEEGLDTAESNLLRNFFSVNLSRPRSDRRKRPKIKVASKDLQMKRLENLFFAISDPVKCKKIPTILLKNQLYP